jgi:hypothetical protein
MQVIGLKDERRAETQTNPCMPIVFWYSIHNPIRPIKKFDNKNK